MVYSSPTLIPSCSDGSATSKRWFRYFEALFNHEADIDLTTIATLPQLTINFDFSMDPSKDDIRRAIY